MSTKFNKIGLLILAVMMIQTSIHSQCEDDPIPIGDLDAKNLAYSPSDIYSCSKVTVTAEWDVISQISYDADHHVSKLIVSLPNEFIGTSGSYTITASDGIVYWDSGLVTLTDAELQVPLSGVIPAATNLSLMIIDMDVDLGGAAFVLFNVSQSVSNIISDCNPGNDEQSISGLAIAADGPEIVDIVANCTETEVGMDLTANGNGLSFEWEGPADFTSTDEDPTFPMDESGQAGTYTVTVTDVNGCKAVGSIDINATNCMGVILPVRLLSFTAKASGVESVLEWMTATEINNSHFEVERSEDGRIFTKIGEVQGSGTTNESVAYSYVDKVPVAGTNYYRLKQVDHDLGSTYSDIRAVTFGISEAILMYPNPTRGEIRLEGVKQDWCKVEIYNNLGKLVRDRELNGNGTIDISELKPGMYQVRIKDFIGEEIFNSKIIKI